MISFFDYIMCSIRVTICCFLILSRFCDNNLSQVEEILE